MTDVSTSPRSRTFGHALQALWPLEPGVTYLNHGTVGVVPRQVLAAQQAIRDEIERHPARFLIRELADVGQFPMRKPPRMRVAAARVAEFVGASADDVAFVDNATTGCNSVLRSWPFASGDEILLTDQGYGAIAKTAQYVASRTGAVVRTVELPYPGTTPEAIAASIEAALTPRTKMLVIDHISAVSALILPVAAIAVACRKRGVVTLVDGAHALGALPLDIPALGVDFYTGNLHKWAMAPRSSAILWASPARRGDLHPTVISWGYGLGLGAEFDLTGTRDPSPWLASPAGIDFMRELGLDAMRAWNHRTVWDAARTFTERWQLAIPAPESMYGSMVTIPLPERFGPEKAAGLKDALFDEEAIEAQVFAFRGRAWIRLAAQVYNEAADFEKLFAAIEKRA